MNRRDFLISSLAAAGGVGLAACDDHGASNMPKAPMPTTGPDGRRLLPWQNWSGYQHALPAERLAPQDEEELAALLQHSPAPIRPVGAGHSFAALVPTQGSLLSLRNFGGLKAHDAASLTATLGAGTRLGDVGPMLDGVGQALANMPDIDSQTIAGAIATATHGTGRALGALHSYVTGLRLVTPRGEVID